MGARKRRIKIQISKEENGIQFSTCPAAACNRCAMYALFIAVNDGYGIF